MADFDWFFDNNGSGGVSNIDRQAFTAASRGEIDKLTRLVEQGAEVKTLVNGMNCLQAASSNGRTTVVKFLLSLTTCNLSSKTSSGRNALHLAALAGHIDVLKLLCEDDQTSADQLLESTTTEGEAAMHLAAFRGHDEIIAFLVQKQDLKQNTKDGQNALHLACYAGHLPVVELLCASDDTLISAHTGTGQTPLHKAAMAGHLEVVQFLVQTGSLDPRECADDSMSALHLAAMQGHLEVVTYLVRDAGLDANAPTRSGQTALHKAAFENRQDVVEWLLQPQSPAPAPAATSVNAPDGEGRTPLMLAASGGARQVCMLLAQVPELDFLVVDAKGRAAHSLAAEAGYRELASTLARGHYAHSRVRLACRHEQEQEQEQEGGQQEGEQEQEQEGGQQEGEQEQEQEGGQQEQTLLAACASGLARLSHEAHSACGSAQPRKLSQQLLALADTIKPTDQEPQKGRSGYAAGEWACVRVALRSMGGAMERRERMRAQEQGQEPGQGQEQEQEREQGQSDESGGAGAAVADRVLEGVVGVLSTFTGASEAGSGSGGGTSFASPPSPAPLGGSDDAAAPVDDAAADAAAGEDGVASTAPLSSASPSQQLLAHVFEWHADLAYGQWCQLFRHLPEEKSKLLLKAGLQRLSTTTQRQPALTYGEVGFFTMASALLLAQPQPGEVFYDLGSGVGKAVLAAALLYGHVFGRCRGVEVVVEEHNAAMQLLVQARAQGHTGTETGAAGAAAKGSVSDAIGSTDLRQGDFLQSPHLEDWLAADVIFANSFFFPPALVTQIAQSAEHLKKGARIITISRNLHSPHLQQVNEQLVAMSWGEAKVLVYERT